MEFLEQANFQRHNVAQWLPGAGVKWEQTVISNRYRVFSWGGENILLSGSGDKYTKYTHKYTKTPLNSVLQKGMQYGL